MNELKHGGVSVVIPDHIEIPADAGKKTPEELKRLNKARRGVGLTCEQTAKALTQSPDKLTVAGVDPAMLAAAGRNAEDLDIVIVDVEHLLGTVLS